MNLKKPINENYAGVFCIVTTTIKLDNCDNVHHAIVFGNKLIVGKDVQVGSKGIFFPAETQLSEEYLHNNNLYRDNTKNKDINEKGYFENNGRIRCVKFRGHRSEGLFMPLDSLLFAATVKDLATINGCESFDNINGIEICRKYVPKIENQAGTSGSKGNKLVAKKTSRLVANQFRFHPDTSMLGKNMHQVKPDSIISITNKLHGTSFVVSNILIKHKLNWWKKLLLRIGIPLVTTDYDIIYSSRKVIKNDDLNKEYNHYYSTDVWADISLELGCILDRGMTAYGEAVGYARNGKAIQKGYDYGCSKPDDNDDGTLFDESHPYMKIFIYRLTYTNVDGSVFEFSAKQVQDWCKDRDLNAVPEYFYGKAKELLPQVEAIEEHFIELTEEQWQAKLLEKLQSSYNMEKDCELCTNKVPAEGIVLRIEGEEYNAYKLKSFRFRERETKLLDSGEVDIETEESQVE